MAGTMMRECNLCGRLFSSSGGRTCEDCLQYLEEIYPTVRSYIRDSKNPRLDVPAIADALEIPVKFVQGLVNQGYLRRDLPNASADDYENQSKEKLAKELQQAASELKANAARKQSPMTYGQERYSPGKK